MKAVAAILLLLLLPVPMVGADETTAPNVATYYGPDAGFMDYGCADTAAQLVPVDGGYFGPDARIRRIACVFSATAAHRDMLIWENANLREEAKLRTYDTRPYIIACGVTFLMGLASGIYLMWQNQRRGP